MLLGAPRLPKSDAARKDCLLGNFRLCYYPKLERPALELCAQAPFSCLPRIPSCAGIHTFCYRLTVEVRVAHLHFRQSYDEAFI